MYFWKDKDLAQGLADGMVTQKQQMLYMLILGLACGVSMTASFGYTIWSDADPLGLYDYLIDAFFFLTILITILYSYKLNGANNGKDFIQRYACISLPITIKSTILVTVLTMTAFIFDNPGFLNEDMPADIEFNAALEDLEQKFSRKEITIEQFEQLSTEAVLKFEENLEFVTGPLTFLSTVIAQAYVIWRYISCFKIFTPSTDEGEK